MSQETDKIEPMAPVKMVKLNTLSKPQKVFFYERIIDEGENDGTANSVKPQIVSLTEEEAALAIKRDSFRQNHRQIGTSDGKAYNQFILDSMPDRNALIPIERAKEILRGAFEAEINVARGHKQEPKYQNIFFDPSFPIEQRSSFSPPK
jgi:hypothetical protein